MSFDPNDWYWLADDGRVFSTARMAVTNESDEGYLAFVASHGVSRWPEDTNRGQTIASAEEVLAFHGIFGLKDYAADKRWRKEVGGVVVNGLEIPTDRETQGKLTAAFLLANANANSTFKWKLANGSFSPSINATSMKGIAQAVGEFVNNCYSVEELVLNQIEAGTITTRDEVDAAFL